jgi:uncharacterized membrane protein (UPF0127 family)
MSAMAALAGIALLAAGARLRTTVATITTDRGSVKVTVEVADSERARERGLMGRKHLPANRGMLFVFPEPVRDGFWMKNTLIPLSIAFFNGRGRVLRIMVMTPCRADPCPVYYSGVEYRLALEVNRGAFARWHVHSGDRMTVPGVR